MSSHLKGRPFWPWSWLRRIHVQRGTQRKGVASTAASHRQGGTRLSSVHTAKRAARSRFECPPVSVSVSSSRVNFSCKAVLATDRLRFRPPFLRQPSTSFGKSKRSPTSHVTRRTEQSPQTGVAVRKVDARLNVQFAKIALRRTIATDLKLAIAASWSAVEERFHSGRYTG